MTRREPSPAVALVAVILTAVALMAAAVIGTLTNEPPPEPSPTIQLPTI